MNTHSFRSMYFDIGQKVGWIGSEDKQTNYIILSQLNNKDWDSLFLITPNDNFVLPLGTIDTHKNMIIPLKELYHINKRE